MFSRFRLIASYTILSTFSSTVKMSVDFFSYILHPVSTDVSTGEMQGNVSFLVNFPVFLSRGFKGVCPRINWPFESLIIYPSTIKINSDLIYFFWLIWEKSSVIECRKYIVYYSTSGK